MCNRFHRFRYIACVKYSNYQQHNYYICIDQHAEDIVDIVSMIHHRSESNGRTSHNSRADNTGDSDDAIVRLSNRCIIVIAASNATSSTVTCSFGITG